MKTAIGATACLCTTMVWAAGPQTLEMQRERQQGTNLCWAAVSTMAVRAFPKDFADPPITQELSVIYGLSRVHTRTQKLITRRINFGNFEEQCDPVTPAINLRALALSRRQRHGGRGNGPARGGHRA